MMAVRAPDSRARCEDVRGFYLECPQSVTRRSSGWSQRFPCCRRSQRGGGQWDCWERYAHDSEEEDQEAEVELVQLQGPVHMVKCRQFCWIPSLGRERKTTMRNIFNGVRLSDTRNRDAMRARIREREETEKLSCKREDEEDDE